MPQFHASRIGIRMTSMETLVQRNGWRTRRGVPWEAFAQIRDGGGAAKNDCRNVKDLVGGKRAKGASTRYSLFFCRLSTTTPACPKRPNAPNRAMVGRVRRTRRAQERKRKRAWLPALAPMHDSAHVSFRAARSANAPYRAKDMTVRCTSPGPDPAAPVPFQFPGANRVLEGGCSERMKRMENGTKESTKRQLGRNSEDT